LIKKHSNLAEASSIGINHDTCAGIDEVGRGPLAGPVIAAVVVLGKHHDWSGLQDSKKLTPGKRQLFCQEIKQNALAWSVGRCDAHEVDQYNVFNASLLAMQRAFHVLNYKVDLILVDGKYSPVFPVTSYAVIKGDQKIAAISAASIVAKVTRDREMSDLHYSHPDYGFAKHKGYPTAEHLEALKRYGPCIHHRRSFKPVSESVSP